MSSVPVLTPCATCNGSGQLTQGTSRLACPTCLGSGGWLALDSTRLAFSLPPVAPDPGAERRHRLLSATGGVLGLAGLALGSYGLLANNPHTLAGLLWSRGWPNAAFGAGGLLSAGWLSAEHLRKRSPLTLQELSPTGELSLLNDYASSQVDQLLAFAGGTARSLGRIEIDEAVLLLTLLEHPRIQNILLRLERSPGDPAEALRQLYSKARPATTQASRITWRPEIGRRYLQAAQQAIGHGFPYVELEDVMLAFLQDPGDLAPFFSQQKMTYEEFLAVSTWFAEDEERRLRLAFWIGKGRSRPKGFMNRAWTALPTRFLDQYSSDLTRLAAGGRLMAAPAHEKEVEQALAILSRTQRNSLLLVGDPGVGKRSVLAAIAVRMIEGNVPENMQDKRLVSLDVGSLLADQAAAQANMQTVIDEVLAAGNVILAIPDVSLLVGSGTAALSAASLLAEGLSRGSLQLITTASYGDYHRYVESNQQLAADLDRVEVRELSPAQAVQVLEEEAPNIESRLSVRLTYPAIVAAVQLADRYLADQPLPASALGLIDQAAADTGLRKERWVTKEVIERSVQQKTGVPVDEGDAAHASLVLNLEEEMHKRIVGQEDAVAAVAEAIRRATAGLHDSNRPVASFLFVGPTGVGKTEVARTLTKLYYGDERLLIQLDMSEYQDATSIYRLIGPPAGSTESYAEGGSLTQPVREHPHSLILLDEIEKAHPDVLNLFLQLLEDGRLTENTGRTVSFANVIVIATSNAASTEIASLVPGQDLNRRLVELLTKTFRPEFLNRFDRIVPFRSLTQPQVEKIAAIMLSDVSSSMAAKGYAITFAPDAVAYLAKAGFDPSFGARPLRRAIQDKVEGLLARLILEHRLLTGQSLQVTAEMLK